MTKSMILLPLALLAVAASPALAAERKASAEASIAYADSGGVSNWAAQGDQTVYFQDRHRQWYRATLNAPALDLPSAFTIGIDAGPMGRLDKWGGIYVGGRRYSFQSFEKVDGPPERVKAKQFKEAKAVKADS